jgi:hypothetical protein
VEEAEILADIDAVDMDAAGADEDGGPDGGDADNASAQQRDEDPPEVTREEIEGFDVDAYLPVEEADEARRRLQQMEEALDALQEKGLNVPDADDLKQQIAAMNRPMGDEDLPAPATRPDRERHAYRTILDHAVKRAAGTVLHRLDIPAGSALDADLAEAVGSGDEDSNYEVVIRLLNRTLNRAMGKPVGDGAPSGRNEWLVDELKAAKQEVPAARDRVAERIRAATSYTGSGDADDEETDSSGDAVWDDVDWGEPF